MAVTKTKSKKPNVSTMMVTMDSLSADNKEIAIKKSSELNAFNSLQINNFGNEAQEELRNITNKILENVRNQDSGPVGEIMNEALITIRGLDPTVGVGEEPGFIGKLLGKVKPIAKFIQQYEKINSQVNDIVNRLDNGRLKLDENVIKFNMLSDSLLRYYNELKVYMAAIEQKIHEVQTNDLQNAIKQAKKTNDMMDNQHVDDIQKQIEFMERKKFNLQQSLHVVMQALPSIKLLNDNNLNLIQHVGDIINHTIPIWKVQIAISAGIDDQMKVKELSQSISDINNQSIIKNAEMIKKGNKEIRETINNGIFDIEAIEKATLTTISTITETVELSAAGRKTRKEFTERMKQLELELKNALIKSIEITEE